MLNFQEVLGYSFVNSTMNELVHEVHTRVNRSQKTFIVTANPEIITYAQSDLYYDDILKNCDYIIPDGIGIVIASKISGTPLQERLAGFDLMERLLELANRKHSSVYFLGTHPQVIGLTAANIKKKYPTIQIAGFHHGYFSHNDQTAVNEIKETKPDFVFVGLGFPKQEKWIAENLHHFSKGVFVGIGGCLNIWAGVNKRAPKIWVNLNLEWLYRLIKEPSRSKRMLAIPIFLKRVFFHQFRGDRN